MSPWTHEEALEMHAAHWEGNESLASIGKRYGVSHEAIRQLFIHYGLPRRSNADRAIRARQAREVEAEQQRERVMELYKQHGTIAAVLAEVDLPRRLVTAIVNTIPNREAYRHRGTLETYPREELIAALQRAARHSGEPLTIPGYREAAKDLGLPSYDTHIRHFSLEDPETPWLTALDAAGIEGNAARGRRANATNLDQCVDAVARCIKANKGKRVSYDAYRAWAKGKDVPSGATIRGIVGWNTAVELALDKLASV